MTGSQGLRVCVLLLIVLGTAVLLPHSALCGPGGTPRDAQLFTVPGSVAGTIGPEGTPLGTTGPNWRSWFSFEATAGQTYCLAFQPSALFASWIEIQDTGSPTATLISTDDGWSPTDDLFFMPQHTGRYTLIAHASDVCTFTLSAEETGAVTFRLGETSLPRLARPGRRFTIMAMLNRTYDGLYPPVSFEVQRLRPSGWRVYGRVPGTHRQSSLKDLSDWPNMRFTGTLRLPKGRFRIRARFKDAAHPVPKFDSWQAVVVR